jgi:hypothetical protein
MSDRKEIFPPAPCSRKDCLSLWQKICQTCNLAYCGAHHKNHTCKPEDRGAREALYITDFTDLQDPVEELCLPPPL